VLTLSTRPARIRSVWTRWSPPTNALTPSTAAIIAASTSPPTAADIPAPAAKTGVSGVSNSPMTALPSPTGPATSWLLPCAASRLRASASLNPSGLLSKVLSTASAGRACQGVVLTGGLRGCRSRFNPAHAPTATEVSAAPLMRISALRPAWGPGMSVNDPPSAEPPTASMQLRRLTSLATPVACIRKDASWS
jgi:hypothetical protein